MPKKPKPDTPAGQSVSLPDSLRLDRFLPYRLNVLSGLVSESFARSYEDLAARHGIDKSQWRVISFLGEQLGTELESRGMTARDISSRTYLQKVMVSRAIAALEASALIRRRVNANDRREAFLALTPAGKKVYWAIVPAALGFEAELLRDLPEKDVAAFWRVADHLLSLASARRRC